jgi:hypothetical protein
MSTASPVYAWPKSMPTMKSGKSSPTIDAIVLLPIGEAAISAQRGAMGICERKRSL